MVKMSLDMTPGRGYGFAAPACEPSHTPTQRTAGAALLRDRIVEAPLSLAEGESRNVNVKGLMRLERVLSERGTGERCRA